MKTNGAMLKTLEKYGIDHYSSLHFGNQKNPLLKITEGATSFALKEKPFHMSDAELLSMISLQNKLNELLLPCPIVKTTIGGKLFVSEHERTFYLQEWIPGCALPEQIDRKLVGGFIAHIREIMLQINVHEYHLSHKTHYPSFKQMDLLHLKKIFYNKNINAHLTEKMFSTYHPITCRICISSLKYELVHGDFHPENIIFDNDRFALIDFEAMHYAFPHQDLASMLIWDTMWVVENNHYEAKHIDSLRFADILKGYSSHIYVSKDDIDLIYALLCILSIYSVANAFNFFYNKACVKDCAEYSIALLLKNLVEAKIILYDEYHNF